MAAEPGASVRPRTPSRLPCEAMRLTVGTLPAAVYWRRRAVVFIGLAMIVLVVSYACGGPNESIAGDTAADPTGSPSTSQAAPNPTTTPPSVVTPSPQQSAFSLPIVGATGPCTDAEIEVTATAGAALVQRGQPVDVSIKIKNVSTRACSRDLGADVQELRLVDREIVVWSSDDCNPRKGSDVRAFTAGKEYAFTLTWAGPRSRTGAGAVPCAAPAPEPAVYQLIARLAGKLSPAFSLRIQG